MLDHDPILPAWLVLPLAGLSILILSGHFLALNADREMDAQRRRIRMTNGILMMVTVPLVAYGFSIASPDHSRTFVYVWVLAAAMLFMIIMVAGIDMLHSWRLHRVRLRELRAELAAARNHDARAALLGVTIPRPTGAERRPGDERGR
jgi:hypothetical protein